MPIGEAEIIALVVPARRRERCDGIAGVLSRIGSFKEDNGSGRGGESGFLHGIESSIVGIVRDEATQPRGSRPYRRTMKDRGVFHIRCKAQLPIGCHGKAIVVVLHVHAKAEAKLLFVRKTVGRSCPVSGGSEDGDHDRCKDDEEHTPPSRAADKYPCPYRHTAAWWHISQRILGLVRRIFWLHHRAPMAGRE